MSLVEIQGPESRNSPGLTINLPSNNPFRNRAVSPASYHSLPSPQTPAFNIPNAAPERPTSRNPFLDQNYRPQAASPPQMISNLRGRMSPSKPTFTSNTTELFDNLALDDNFMGNGSRQPTGPPLRRRENVPQSMQTRSGPPGHRPSRSEEEQRRLRIGGKPRGPQQELDIFADPVEPRRHRLRRNSDSSIASRMVGSEDDRRRRERRHREREARRDGKVRPYGTSSKPKKPSQRLDIIDSLDVTSIFGTGVFHHDGPFDACNPDRNRKGSKAAPMKAFAKDSINNTLGGSGPVNKDLDLNQYHGRGAEGFTDFSASGTNGFIAEPEPYAGADAPLRPGARARAGIDRTTAYNTNKLIEPVHGDESLGLGTSTFLEGAPAARVAIERRESESEGVPGGGGLSRKKSLAQKIRGINVNRHGDRPSGRVGSPESTVYDRPMSPASPGEVSSGGGMPKIQETKPFFNEYDDLYEKKGQKIHIAEQQNRIEGEVSRLRATSSPKRGPAPGMLERRVTHDGAGTSADGEAKKEGFLSRVKSLRGGRRPRPDRREY